MECTLGLDLIIGERRSGMFCGKLKREEEVDASAAGDAMQILACLLKLTREENKSISSREKTKMSDLGLFFC